jgi:hypothetical protein
VAATTMFTDGTGLISQREIEGFVIASPDAGNSSPRWINQDAGVV